MGEKRYSGTLLLFILGVAGLATFGLLMFHLFESDKTLPENIKAINRLESEKTKACDRSNDKERCAAAVEALRVYLDQSRKNAATQNKQPGGLFSTQHGKGQ